MAERTQSSFIFAASHPIEEYPDGNATQENDHEGRGGTKKWEKDPQLPPSEKLVREGVSFLSGQSKTLKSPEATRQLVDTIVKT